MYITPENHIRVLVNETFHHRGLVVGIFVAINLFAVALGFTWPKLYTSSTTIYVEEKSIIQPLMQGAAVVTDVKDRARIAKEVIFSRKIMEQVLEEGGWLEAKPSDIDKEKLIENLMSRTSIVNVGANLIKIEYRDISPERAYKTTQKYSERFISESLGTQTQESQAAFEFIDSQVKEYHAKLTTAEGGLKEFRSKNVDARPGTEAEVAGRINALQATIEKTSLELKEAQIKQVSLEKQLSGEAEVTASLTREGQYLARISDLQAHLDTLLLTYHDTYPDVVRTKRQIEDLKEVAVTEQRQREQASKSGKSAGRPFTDESVRVNPLYQQLKRDLFDTKTSIETLTARWAETKRILREELERARRIHGGEADLAELTRDYEVNRDIYQDLLRRRENARVSKNLDRDNQGLSLRVQEPAFLPLRPSGLRLLHFVFAGLLLSVIVPPALIFGALSIDPRIRYSSLIMDKLNLPVLAEVPHLRAPSEIAGISRSIKLHVIVIFIAIGFVVAMSLLRTIGVV